MSAMVAMVDRGGGMRTQSPMRFGYRCTLCPHEERWSLGSDRPWRDDAEAKLRMRDHLHEVHAARAS